MGMAHLRMGVLHNWHLQKIWKFCNHQFLCFCNTFRILVEAETSIKGTVIKYLSSLQNKIIRRLRDSCQGTKDFVAWQKIVGRHVWIWVTIEKILVGEKKSFTLQMASCWQIFLQNKQNYAQCEQGLRWSKQGLAWGLFRHEWVDTFKY